MSSINLSIKRFLSPIIILLPVLFTSMVHAQTVPGASTVPDQTNGRDHAGRPVEVKKVPAAAPLAPSEQQQFQREV